MPKNREIKINDLLADSVPARAVGGPLDEAVHLEDSGQAGEAE